MRMDARRDRSMSFAKEGSSIGPINRQKKERIVPLRGNKKSAEEGRRRIFQKGLRKSQVGS